MKIFYLTNARLPTEKAHGLATVKLCEAFAKQGVEVTIFAPRRFNPLKQDLYEYYQLERNFKVCFLPSIDFLWLGFGERFFFLVQLFSFSIIAAFWLFIRYGISGKLRSVVIFSHDHIPLYFVSFFAPKIFYDIHDLPLYTPFYTRVLKKSAGFSVQTKSKIDKLHDDFSISKEKIVYWPNGTDVERFDIPLSKEAAREKLGLPQDKKLVLYTGKLFPGRGADTLVEASRFLSADVMVYIVGGNQQDIEKFKIRNSEFRIRFVEHRPWAEMPVWIRAADIVVVPHSGKMHQTGIGEVSLYYISPMKLFEYMASGRPIVASDIPSIREVVDETMVFFARPDDPRSFSEAIQKIFDNPSEAAKRSERARKESRKYTWEARAEKIIEKIQAVS